MALYTCPYCFTQHEMSDVEFRCLNLNGSCGTEDDLILTNYEGGDPNHPLVKNKVFKPKMSGFKFIARKFMPIEERCPNCKQVSAFRICPSCHNQLSPNAHDNEDMIISIVGSRASGKSHYIGVLIDELQKRVIPELFSGNFMETDKSIRDHYMKSYYYPLYQLGKPLELTNPNEKQKALIYETTIEKGNKTQNLTFIFYDTAGENYEDLMTMSTVNKYICQSAGIIFLVDPTQVEELRLQMDDDKLNAACNIKWEEIVRSTPDAIIDRVAKLIRQANGKTKGKIDIPVAVAFAKIDAIDNLFPRGSRVLEPSTMIKNGTLDMSEAAQINEEMRAMLANWGEKRVTTVLNNNFSNVSYFGVSALGQSPKKSENPHAPRSIDRPRPLRVADPFVWILNKIKLVK